MVFKCLFVDFPGKVKVGLTGMVVESLGKDLTEVEWAGGVCSVK